jgi:hypothetical protein
MMKLDHDRHVEKCKADIMMFTFNYDKNESSMKNILQKTENLKVYMDGKLEQM